MLASPLLPAPTFGLQPREDDFRPAKDIETFNSLLPPPVEFVEGSSSGAYAIPAGKYRPINVPSSPKSTRFEPSEPAAERPTTPKPVSKPDTPSKTPLKSLYPSGLDMSWPSNCNVGSGLYNLGNTCFLNSALQCLLHTPPLLQVIAAHKSDSCKGFCMACSLRETAAQSFKSRSSFSPSAIAGRLQAIAKHMRKGRQEDTHEFLRYAIDALQKSCLAGHPPKIDHKLAETTWVHQIFGGRLRSRVTCRDCGYNSDTFDRILDLSLDIFKVDSVKDALKKFVAIDYLKGADKYKCEKCKKPVTAEKRFTIHEAPPVLTVHLKRFSPLGRKIGHHVSYDEQLSLQPYMSEGSFGPTYNLYGVICHAGGGPNSGHYYAFVKSRDGKWWEMNDESVSTIAGPPLSKKSAYVLFYIKAKGQGLEGAVRAAAGTPVQKESRPKARLSDSMKGAKQKGREESREEDIGTKVDRPFIGPLLPSPAINGDSKKVNGVDPQALALKNKIAKARSTITSLSQYQSDDEGDDAGEPVDGKSSPVKDVEMDRASLATQTSSATPKPTKDSGNEIPPASFYGPSSTKKRKSPEGSHNEGSSHKKVFNPNNHKSSMSHSNPYNRVTYSKKNRRPPRGF
ncbi:Usp36 protein [Coprinopsis sp. MPI-PUGE-AT-0042]|nr:Usp36 protein [Coprinopsis sp. MPI-PUGE-AT-0042]